MPNGESSHVTGDYAVYYKSIDAIPDTVNDGGDGAGESTSFPRVFQITGTDCDRERVRMWAVLAPSETIEHLHERIREYFDDCHIDSIEEEDISYVE